MIQPDKASCDAAVRSLCTSHLRPGLGSAGQIALDAGKTYLASDGDALSAFSATLSAVSAASLALGPPLGPLVAVVLGTGSQGVQVVSNFLSRSAKHAARFLPVQATKKVLDGMGKAWGTYGQEGAKDKLCQAARANAVAFAAVSAAKGATGLDCANSSRVANRVYHAAVSAGAPKWAAAMAAWKIAKDAGCTQATLDAYASEVGAVNAEQRANPEAVWAAKVKIGGLAVSANTLASTPIQSGSGSGSGGGAILAAAVGLAALFLG